MKKTISQRIKEGLELRGLKQSELVEKTGIGKSSISTYISGAYEPKQGNIYKIAKALDVNEAWLMGYDVPMDRVNTVNKLEVTQEELALLNNYNKLNSKGKEKLLDYSNDLVVNPLYNTTDEISATKDIELMPIAAHDDDLTDDEKDLMQKRIEEYEKNK